MDGDAGPIDAAAAVKVVCLWCETEFEPRKGGSPQRFCQTKCRDGFHSAGRRWAEQAVISGRLSVAERHCQVNGLWVAFGVPLCRAGGNRLGSVEIWD
jgi:hypothetical protein